MKTLTILPGRYSVCRLAPNYLLGEWAYKGEFYSISKTKDELSVVCAEMVVPENIKSERGWKLLKVEGPLDFSLTGIIAAISRLLADIKVSVFAISTYDTDYVLIKAEQLKNACGELEKGGFTFYQSKEAI